jgi:cellulose synthase/poly-beta-1,6-N-acetylglucosamine synthase-like glycosyltransferase
MPEPGSATVLIPAHNEAATIQCCIAAVRAGGYPLERIIVVADACTDDTAELARAAGAEVVEVQVADKAEAQNAVLGSITSELLVGFDGDTFPARDCVKRMVRRMRRDQLDAVCATVLPAQPKGLFHSRPPLRLRPRPPLVAGGAVLGRPGPGPYRRRLCVSEPTPSSG